MKALPVTIFASSAAAQITTSFWFPVNFLGTDKITYVASVVGAESDRMTLAVRPSDDPDYSALGLATEIDDTYTFASTLFEYSTSQIMRIGGGATRDTSYHYRCEIQPADTNATCTYALGADLRRSNCISRGQYPDRFQSDRIETQLWTFSDQDTAGVETIMRTRPGVPTTPVPEWCTALSNGEGPIPSSVLTRTGQIPRSTLTTYTFIITAGEEKLPATTGGTPSTSTAEPTGLLTTSGEEGTATSAAKSGVAGPMRTVAPALAGLGAAAAVFL